MPLTKHLEQGQLLYFTRNPNAITVSENNYYRWLAFDDVIQSVMNKRHPSRLTLPHHFAILQPLMTFRPATITEFGLGGGNIARFIRSLSLEIKYQVIESDLKVIHCHQQFFNTEQAYIQIEHENAMRWLRQQRLKQAPINVDYHWFIYDIFQHSDVHVSATNEALYLLIEQLTVTQALTVNLPFVSAVELSHLVTLIHATQPQHRLTLYHVPHHQNKVLHLLPGLEHQQKEYVCPVPTKQIKYWQRYHQLFNIKWPTEK